MTMIRAQKERSNISQKVYVIENQGEMASFLKTVENSGKVGQLRSVN